MRKLIASFVTAMTLIIGVPLVVSAQEANHKQYGTLEGHTDTNSRDEEAAPDNELVPSKSLVKQDTATLRGLNRKTPEAQKPAVKKPASAGGGEEAPFNFLYYIIQRFKTADIIED